MQISIILLNIKNILNNSLSKFNIKYHIRDYYEMSSKYQVLRFVIKIHPKKIILFSL